MKPTLRLLVPAAAVLVLAGCSTPASRIAKNPEVFASFPPDVQAKVKEGKVDVGFPKEAVEMALGRPDRQYTRTTEAGEVEVWSYVGVYTTTERQHVNGRFRVRDPMGGYQTVSDSIWVDVQQEHEYELLRVEFEDGKAKAIERVNR